MSILTDFFSASSSEIDTLQLPDALQGRVVVQTKNVMPEDVAQLAFILTGRSDIEPVAVEYQGDEFALYALPDDLVLALAGLGADDVRRAAQEWEIGPTEYAIELLGELRSIAQTARLQKQRVFLVIRD
jgi:hypothetical protein